MTPKKKDVHYPPMLDALLSNFVSCYMREKASSPANPPINWEVLSQAIPNTDPEMCRQRFNELCSLDKSNREHGQYVPEVITQTGSDGKEGSNDPLYEYVQSLFQKDEKEQRSAEKVKRRNERAEKQKQDYDDTGNTDCDTRSTTPSPFPSSSTLHNTKLQGGPSMVIHVCDEAKNLRQDFTCPRDLLIQEMRYFAEYLSVDSQRLEEVDISVHCDIHIFDWLMRFVKRNSGLVDLSDKPKLEPSNVVSILISSDFLKMDSLVEECISYCYNNLSAIVSTPCNMNCVNEKLTDRIASRFKHGELEEIKDRKDKFKSKLYCRKIDKLFSSLDGESTDSPNNATRLFRCRTCGRVLTHTQRNKLPCTNNRMCIDASGNLSYEHELDMQWDVSNFLSTLHDELKKWSMVYWRLWGIVNHLLCSRCNQVFQLCEFGHCQYHPERPQFRQVLEMQAPDNPVGLYPCCNQRVLRFDPTGLSKGCRLRDHVAVISSKKEQKLLDDLIAHKGLVKIQNQITPAFSDLNIFSAEESTCGVLEPTSTPAEILSPPPPPPFKYSPKSIKVQRTVSASDQYYTGLADNSEEDTGEEDAPIKPRKYSSSSQMSTISSQPAASLHLPDVTMKQQTLPPITSTVLTPSAAVNKNLLLKRKDKIVIPSDESTFGQFPSKQKWEQARSIRWNQDVQREEDMRRLQDITMQLAKQRIEKAKTKETRDFPGGIFSKLEASFHANLKSTGGISGRQQGGGSNRDTRARGRQTQLNIKNISIKIVKKPLISYPYSGYPDNQEATGEEEEAIKPPSISGPSTNTAPLAQAPLSQRSLSVISRSASCNRINLGFSNRKPKRSFSTSGPVRPVIVHHPKTETSSISEKPVEVEPTKEKAKRNSFPDSVIARLTRQYSFSRSRRATSSTSSMSSVQGSTEQVRNPSSTKSKPARRRRNKDSSKKKAENKQQDDSNLAVPKQCHGRIPSPIQMTLTNCHVDGDFPSSPDSPSHFQNVFPSPPASPSRLNVEFMVGGRISPNCAARSTQNLRGNNSSAFADESPLPSPPPDDKSYDSGRPMSLDSLRSFGSGRPTSLSSVTSSISSRTSRGSDYFSSASSTGQPTDQQQQVTSYRLGLQTVLPDLNESDSTERFVADSEAQVTKRSTNSDTFAKSGNHNSNKISSIASSHGPAKGRSKSDVNHARAAAFAAQDKDLNHVDHLSPVATMAMLANPELSYVDRVILELLETEQMYVKSLRDILTGYLATIRSTPELKIHPNDVEDLFGNIRDIYDFNRNLLADLEGCCGDPVHVASCFVSKDEDFRVYTEYCTNYPCSVAAMTRCMRNPGLARFFKVQQDHLRHTLPLGSYLLKPVQRILKYHLLLQELVKHCDKQCEGYPTIQTALHTMTRVAKHINDMKRKHEDAVHIQEIQSLLTNWEGNELATYGELVLETEMKMQGAKNERQVFLFEKMILITKRREDGYLVCKVNIMCSNLVMLESIPNVPLGFQIQPFSDNLPSHHNPHGREPQNDPARLQRYTMLAPSIDEKKLWTYHIKRLIIENHHAAIPLKAKQSIMRMKAKRDGDIDISDEEMQIKEKPRFGPNALLGSKKATTEIKTRRRSDPYSRKGLHLRALRKKDEVESSDDISSDSVPNTPSGLKVPGKFSFPSLRPQTTRPAVSSTAKTTYMQVHKPTPARANSETKSSTTKHEQPAPSNGQNKAAKPHHQSVIYRRHKRRTSQPITIIEKRLSMKLPDGEEKGGEAANCDGENAQKLLDDEDLDELMNFNPLTARESISWDIQIVEAVFERYKQESAKTADVGDADNDENNTSLDSTFLTVRSDVAPSPLMALDHTPNLSERRKSRIVVVPSDTSGDEKNAKKLNKNTAGTVIRRRKDKINRTAYRTSGVVYNLSQEKEVESDGGVDETKNFIRKITQASEGGRKSMVIHESDTDIETNRILKEKAVVARRKSSLRRRERNIRRKASENNETNSLKASSESLSNVTPSAHDVSETDGRRRSIYDNLDDGIVEISTTRAEDGSKNVTTVLTTTTALSKSPFHLSTMPTISTPTSSTNVVTTHLNSRMCSIQGSIVHGSANNNLNNNKQKQDYVQSLQERLAAKNTTDDTKNIPSGTVRGLMQLWSNDSNSGSPSSKVTCHVTAPTVRTPVTSSRASITKIHLPFESINSPKTNASVVCCRQLSVKSSPTSSIDKFSLNETQSTKHDSNDSEDILEIWEDGDNKVARSPPSRYSVLTTASLPLTLTSSSSSGNESETTIVERVKRLSNGDYDKALNTSIESVVSCSEMKRIPGPALFIRRTFSREDNSNTRRSTNLVLEARMSGEYTQSIPTDDMVFHGVTEDVPLGKEDAVKNRFSGDESLNDAKHYLFEKLCLTTPGESKITDKMSEDFEHVCSDLEKKQAFGKNESHTFSTSEDDINERSLQGKEKGSVHSKKEKENIRRDTEQSIESLKQHHPHKKAFPEEDIVPNTYIHRHDVTVSDVHEKLAKVDQQHVPKIIPRRSDSIRSTRSEYLPVQSSLRTSRDRNDNESKPRGRCLSNRSRNSFMSRLPARDFEAIPQKNVLRLTKQFSEITKTSEKLATPLLRRSKSVGVSSRIRQRLQVHANNKEAKLPSQQQQDKTTLYSSSTSNISTSNDVSQNKNQPNCKKPTKSFLQNASIRVDEKLTCEITDNSQTLKVINVIHDSVLSDEDNDDVFASPPSEKSLDVASSVSLEGKNNATTCDLSSNETIVENEEEEDHSLKKISLVEMFAANPKPKTVKTEQKGVMNDHKEAQKDEEVKSDNEEKINNRYDPINTYKTNNQRVKVILVHKPNDTGGGRSLEPRVLNLGKASPEANVPRFSKKRLNSDEFTNREVQLPELSSDDKRRSWSNHRTVESELVEKPSTRFRSSSFTRDKRKGMRKSRLSESSELDDCSSNRRAWIERLCRETGDVK